MRKREGKREKVKIEKENIEKKEKRREKE